MLMFFGEQMNKVLWILFQHPVQMVLLGNRVATF